MGAVLVPTHLRGSQVEAADGTLGAGGNHPERQRDVMDDLVDQLAALESKP